MGEERMIPLQCSINIHLLDMLDVLLKNAEVAGHMPTQRTTLLRTSQELREQLKHNQTKQAANPRDAVLGQSISMLRLSVRSSKMCGRLGISTIGNLISRTPRSLLQCKSFGIGGLNEVHDKLEKLGLYLACDTYGEKESL